MLKELKPFIVSLLVIAGLSYGISAYAAPLKNTLWNVEPFEDSTYYLGTTTPSLRAWLRVIADSFYDTDAIDGCATWSSNVLTSTGSACGSGGGGGGSGNVATSSSETSGRIPFWTSTSATPATLSGGVAGFTWDNALTKLTATNIESTNSTSTNATSTNLFTTTASTTNFFGANLSSCTGKLLWTGGKFSCGVDATGTGGAGTISTSTTPTIGNLAYWTTSGAWPETLGTVSTTTLTGNSQIALSNPIAVIGSAGSVLSIVGDSIGDTQLAFNTGQDLTTASSPTFSTLTLSTLGANEIPYTSGGVLVSSPSLTYDSGTGLNLTTELIMSGKTADTLTYLDASKQLQSVTLGAGLTLSGANFSVDQSFSPTWTGAHIFNNITRSTTTQATTTSLAVSNITSAIPLTNANGSFLEYTGTSCTNQFVRSLSALGVATCATVANTDLANSTISGISLGNNLNSLSNGSTLLGTSYNGSATVSDWDIDLSNGNVWTSASTTFVGGVTIGTATTTSATSTNFFATTASTTNFFGAGLTTCQSNNVLTYNGAGRFGCEADDTGGGGGANSKWATSTGTTIIPNGLGGIIVSASSTIDALTTRLATSTSATTTSFAISGITSAIPLTNANGSFLEYAGTSCTNQFVRSLDALGVATCATVSAGDVSLANLTATDSTLTFSGTYNGSVARTIGLNLSNANTWTGGQIFGNSTTTNATTTSLAVLNLTQASCDVKATTGGVIYCGSDATGGAGGTDKWATSTAVSTSIYVNSATKIGIGTTSPFARLSITGEAGTTYPLFQIASSTNSPIFTVESNSGDDSDIAFGPSIFNQWLMGYDATDESFAIASSTALGTLNKLSINKNGNVYVTDKLGVGTSTPWGLLSVASSTHDGRTPLFSVATSTGVYGSIFNIFATSTGVQINGGVNQGFARASDVGARVGIGAVNGNLIRDQLLVKGRINTEDYLHSWCDAPQNVALSADGVMTSCPGFYFAEDGTGTTALGTPTGGGASYTRIAAAVNNDGVGVFANGSTGTGWLTLGSSTPVLEGNVRIRYSGATTTRYFFGFSNINIAGTTYETEPTVGCYLTASSTQANWQAICRTSLTAMTQVNTGVASTTVTGTAGTGYQFLKMRVEADNNTARFFIQSSESTEMQNVANISTNYPNTTLLNAGIHYGITSINTSSGMDFFRLRFWWRDTLPIL